MHHARWTVFFSPKRCIGKKSDYYLSSILLTDKSRSIFDYAHSSRETWKKTLRVKMNMSESDAPVTNPDLHSPLHTATGTSTSSSLRTGGLKLLYPTFTRFLGLRKIKSDRTAIFIIDRSLKKIKHVFEEKLCKVVFIIFFKNTVFHSFSFWYSTRPSKIVRFAWDFFCR